MHKIMKSRELACEHVYLNVDTSTERLAAAWWERADLKPSRSFISCSFRDLVGIWILRRIAVAERVQELARLFEFNSLHQPVRFLRSSPETRRKFPAYTVG